ncbi:hypothetical protein ALO_03461 [Acetonema longum DSM 6540]|uniref:Uncharacterized protein n=1 Tax=Acetonema longum DSM 6540 TaxID=1009370 RepID=F7NF67_9FIRM|nr:hypothetical protein ALO_03461 [Acetonema longum DSM 6540]
MTEFRQVTRLFSLEIIFQGKIGSRCLVFIFILEFCCKAHLLLRI